MRIELTVGEVLAAAEQYLEKKPGSLRFISMYPAGMDTPRDRTVLVASTSLNLTVPASTVTVCKGDDRFPVDADGRLEYPEPPAPGEAVHVPAADARGPA